LVLKVLRGGAINTQFAVGFFHLIAATLAGFVVEGDYHFLPPNISPQNHTTIAIIARSIRRSIRTDIAVIIIYPNVSK